jgi:hypothetical protein
MPRGLFKANLTLRSFATFNRNHCPCPPFLHKLTHTSRQPRTRRLPAFRDWACVFTAFCIHRVKDLRPDEPGPHARINLSLAWSRYPPKTSQAGQGHIEPDPSCLARLSMPVLKIPHPGAPGASAA